MLHWDKIKENAAMLDEEVESISLLLDTTQFVILSEILLDVTANKRVHMDQPQKVAEVLRTMQFGFKKKAE